MLPSVSYQNHHVFSKINTLETPELHRGSPRWMWMASGWTPPCRWGFFMDVMVETWWKIIDNNHGIMIESDIIESYINGILLMYD